MRKIIAVVISIILALSVTTQAFAVNEQIAELYNVYSDNMIFQQDQPIVLAGTSVPGNTITAKLFDRNERMVRNSETTVAADGTFSVSLNGVSGSFNEYTVRVYVNDKLFDELTKVVFGEVWLASGQSNMQYPLSQDKEGIKLFESHEKLDPWIRVMLVPAITKYNGSSSVIPYDPQSNIEKVQWVTGEDNAVYETSAVAYWFADKLRQELDVPVGIINASLGGSSIMSWISRDTIEKDSFLKQELVKADKYFDKDNWDSHDFVQAFDMTANYNLKIYPLRHFTCAGMIWYQGETDCMFNWDYGVYSDAVDCLQSDYSKLLAPAGKTLPFIFSSLAASDYGKVRTAYDMNEEFVSIQQSNSEHRALVANYDVSLDYFEEVGSIHPNTKRPVGERMTHSAMGLVYGSDSTYTAATPISTEVKGSDIYVKFRNTGKGLTSQGQLITHFSVSGEDGVYISANAEIVSPDTVKVSAENVKNPVSVTYAYSNATQDANLYSESENGYLMPVATFITNKLDNPCYANFTSWMDCESKDRFRVISPSDMIGLYPLWNGSLCNINCNSDSAYTGYNGFNITSRSPLFSINPFFNYQRFGRDYICSDIVTDLSNYGTISFMVKNNGTKPVDVSSVKIYATNLLWYSPETEDGSLSYTIPADGEWHKVVFNLNSLHQWGLRDKAAFGNEKLTSIKNIKVNFENELLNNADISIDSFSYSSDGKQAVPTRYSDNKLVDMAMELVGTVLVKLFDSIYS